MRVTSDKTHLEHNESAVALIADVPRKAVTVACRTSGAAGIRAVLCPPGASQMAVVGSPRSIRLLLGIDVQHDPGYLAPVGAFGVSIQDTQMRDPRAPRRRR
jgi:hypothetical protein